MYVEVYALEEVQDQIAKFYPIWTGNLDIIPRVGECISPAKFEDEDDEPIQELKVTSVTHCLKANMICIYVEKDEDRIFPQIDTSVLTL